MKIKPESIINNIILRTWCVVVRRTWSQVQGSSPMRKAKFQVFLILQSCFFALLLYTSFFPSLNHLHINNFLNFFEFHLEMQMDKRHHMIFLYLQEKIVQTNTLSQSVLISILLKTLHFFT